MRKGDNASSVSRRILHRVARALLALTLLGGAPAGAAEAPRRIISVDYCADQYVLRFAPRAHILAVSPDAAASFSYERASAIGLPTVRPRAEDVLVKKPDLVVRAYGGGPRLPGFLERAGIPVLEVGWVQDIDGVMVNVERLAAGLGAVAEGRALVRKMKARLAALPQRSDRSVLYMTPAGVSAGPGTLVHELLTRAGLANFQAEPGWRPLPLERLAYEQPSLIAAAFFGASTNHLDSWSPSRHPVARAQLRARDVVPLDGAWTACGGWFLVDAVEALARGASR
jgi:iron complex transport system substrate-binding protein